MTDKILMIIPGALITVLGVLNCMGNISSIHSYNRCRVSENDRVSYGRCVGIGSIVIGVSLAAVGALAFVLRGIMLELALIPACIIGVGFILYGQFKYNKGIF